MKVELKLKGDNSILSLEDGDTVTVILKGIKYIIKEGTFGGIILVKHDLEADELLSIVPINHNSISIR